MKSLNLSMMISTGRTLPGWMAYAESHEKPCRIFYNRNKAQLSTMLTGNPYFHVHPYEKKEDIYAVLDEVLQ